MITGGLLGLFVGAVFLSLGYVILMSWVDNENISNEEQENDESMASLIKDK